PDDFASRCLEAARERAGTLMAERAAFAFAIALGRRPARLSAALARSLRSDLAGLIRLAARYPGQPEEGLRPAELAIPGTEVIVDGKGRVRLRPTIPGSSIQVGPQPRSVRGATAAHRLGQALAVIDAAWPGAGREVRIRTRLVVPRDEAGLVSY